MGDDTSEKKTDEAVPYQWMMRPCLIYKEEYNDCTSIKGRFHQYFIHGTTIDCTQWGRDADNCRRWEESEDIKALESLIESEKKRRISRLKTYVENNVMEIRDGPPEDWNKPLPEWMEKEYNSTFLAAKAVEMKNNTDGDNGRLCVIL